MLLWRFDLESPLWMVIELGYHGDIIDISWNMNGIPAVNRTLCHWHRHFFVGNCLEMGTMAMLDYQELAEFSFLWQFTWDSPGEVIHPEWREGHCRLRRPRAQWRRKHHLAMVQLAERPWNQSWFLTIQRVVINLVPFGNQTSQWEVPCKWRFQWENHL